MNKTSTDQKDYWEANQSSRRKFSHPVVNAVYSDIASKIHKTVAIGTHTSILDVGCGNGFLSLALEKYTPHVVGLDISSSMLAVNPLARLVQADAAHMPFKDNSFDVVCATQMLHHIQVSARKIVIREIKRITKKWVILFEPNRNNPLTFAFAALIREERLALQFSKKHLQDLLEGRGLEVLTIDHACFCPPNKTPTSLLPYFEKYIPMIPWLCLDYLAIARIR